MTFYHLVHRILNYIQCNCQFLLVLVLEPRAKQPKLSLVQAFGDGYRVPQGCIYPWSSTIQIPTNNYSITSYYPALLQTFPGTSCKPQLLAKILTVVHQVCRVFTIRNILARRTVRHGALWRNYIVFLLCKCNNSLKSYSMLLRPASIASSPVQKKKVTLRVQRMHPHKISE